MTTCDITTLRIWDTTYSADSVEWCPLAPYYNVFVCGTYHLIQNESKDDHEKFVDSDKTQSRCMQVKSGCLYVMVIDSSFSVRNLQTLKLDAVLDTKWCRKRVKDKILLAVATAKGEVLVYELNENIDLPEEPGFQCSLKLLTKVKLLREDDDDILALSLDWYVNKCEDHDITTASITASDSHGGVSLLKFVDSALVLQDCWKVHKYEAWISAFDYWNSTMIYSGGDDNKFLILDTRTGTQNPVLVNKTHEMGVTSIHCNEAKEYSVVSGSYDEKIRFWDTRNLRRPLSSTSLVGGIWRLKWDPHDFNYIVAACMYGGFCIVNAENPITPDIVAIYKEHNSLAYGCDWSYFTDTQLRPLINKAGHQIHSEELSLMASCSFYDHKLCVSLVHKNLKNS